MCTPVPNASMQRQHEHRATVKVQFMHRCPEVQHLKALVPGYNVLGHHSWCSDTQTPAAVHCGPPCCQWATKRALQQYPSAA